MVEPGDLFARSDQLDGLVIEDELDEFFEGLLQYCQEFGRELKKPDLGFEAVLLCRDFRAVQKKFRSRRITSEDYSVTERDCIWRAMELKDTILTLFSRRAA